MTRFRKAIVGFLETPIISRTSGILLLVLGSYLTCQKLFDFSFSDWLLNETGIKIAKHGKIYNVAFGIFWLCVFRQAVLLIFPNILKAVEEEAAEDASPVKCIQINNHEIEQYVTRLEEPGVTHSEFLSFHKYSDEILSVVSVIGPAIREYFNANKLKNRHIFISIYESSSIDSQNENDYYTLKYVAHYPLNRDDVGTKTIFCKDEHLGFAASRCFLENKKVLLLDARKKNSYFIGTVKRRKKIKHYIGVPISFLDKCHGIMNIEFHEMTVFSSEDEMKQFYVHCISPFRRLIEYQMLKKVFFRKLYYKWINKTEEKISHAA